MTGVLVIEKVGTGYPNSMTPNEVSMSESKHPLDVGRYGTTHLDTVSSKRSETRILGSRCR